MTLNPGDIWPLGDTLIGGLRLTSETRLVHNEHSLYGFRLERSVIDPGSKGKPVINILDILEELVL